VVSLAHTDSYGVTDAVLTCALCGASGATRVMLRAPEGVYAVRPGNVLCATCCRRVVDESRRAGEAVLTPREREVVNLLRHGVTDTRRSGCRHEGGSVSMDRGNRDRPHRPRPAIRLLACGFEVASPSSSVCSSLLHQAPLHSLRRRSPQVNWRVNVSSAELNTRTTPNNCKQLIAFTRRLPNVTMPSTSTGYLCRGDPSSVDRVQASAFAASAEQVAALLTAATEDLIVATDPQGIVTLFNAGAQRLLGYASDEVEGWQTPLIWHDDEEVIRRAAELGVKAGFEVFVHSAREGAPETREWTLVRKDGGRLVAQLTVTPVRDSTSVISGYLGIAHDITARKMAEEGQRAAESRFRMLLEQVPAITYIAGLDDLATTLYVSPQVHRLLGFSAEEWLSDPAMWVERMHPGDREAVLAEFDRCRGSGDPFVAEYLLLARNGETVWLHDEAAIIPPVDGNPGLLQGVMLDITDRKRAEEGLRAAEANYRSIVENFRPRRRYLSELSGWTRNSRRIYDKGKLAELANCIREHGVLQPILVTPAGDRFEVIAGNRRLQAARMLGLERIPATVRPDVDESHRLIVNLVENAQQVDLSPTERIAAVRQLASAAWACVEIARGTGLSPGTVSRWIRIAANAPLLRAPDKGRIDLFRAMHLAAVREESALLELIALAPDYSPDAFYDLVQQRVAGSKTPVDRDERRLALLAERLARVHSVTPAGVEHLQRIVDTASALLRGTLVGQATTL
jgi:ParB/RepB/Spo0J family partition protein/PAS domain S-box-containing protein